MTDELLVQLFYAAQGDITQFRIKARALLADGGKGEAVPDGWKDAFNERHEFDVYPEHFMSGLRNEFAAGWYAALKSTVPQAECAPREALLKVGEASPMPGASAFTMACFEAWRVPVGTKLCVAIEQAAKENQS
jgi:hypothetical protein